jgi:hypothetical protein
MSEFEKHGFEPGAEENTSETNSAEHNYPKPTEVPFYIKEKLEGKSLEEYMLELGERVNYHTHVKDVMDYLDSEAGKGDLRAGTILKYIAQVMSSKKGVIH